MLLYIAGIVAAVLIYVISRDDPPPVAGIYKQKGKWFWLKRRLFYVLLTLRKRRTPASESGGPAGYGVKSKANVESMDCVQVLPSPAEHPKAVDAVYFTGSDPDGCYIVAATARRQNDIVQTLLFLRVPGVGMLELPSLPDTTLKSSNKSAFAAGGLTLTPEVPMKEWKIEFSGKLRMTNTRQLHDVQISLNWTADSCTFDFDTDMNDDALCEGIAREKWTREFFDNLKRAHQTHYEQFGKMSGTINIKGSGVKTVQLRGLRDHSYGNIRDWRDLHRYCIQYICLDDGMYVAVGLICFPKTMSRLLMGYVILPQGTMEAVSWTDFEFTKFGDDGLPPPVMTFQFIAGSKMYRVKCTVVDAPIFYIGDDRDARIHERMCVYDVNGVPGTGVSEWEYRNIERHSLPRSE